MNTNGNNYSQSINYDMNSNFHNYGKNILLLLDHQLNMEDFNTATNENLETNFNPNFLVSNNSHMSYLQDRELNIMNSYNDMDNEMFNKIAIRNRSLVVNHAHFFTLDKIGKL